MKKFLTTLSVLGMIVLTGCTTDASVASQNVSRDADQFRVNRRVVFMNTINGEYMLEMQGNCSINMNKDTQQLEVICKTGENKFKKHFLGVTRNVSYFVEQLEFVEANQYNYKMVLKPSTVVPVIEVK